MSIEQLRERMPALRQREQALRAELQAIADQANDRAAFLRLAETLTAFLARLRGAADTLSITERQRIVRLVVKDVLIGDDTITIRHSIPVPQGPPQGGCLPPSRTGSQITFCVRGVIGPPWGVPSLPRTRYPAFHQSRFQIASDQLADPFVLYLASHACHQHIMIHTVEELLQVHIHDPSLALRNVAPCRLHTITSLFLSELVLESLCTMTYTKCL